MARTVVVIGAGPRGTSVVERLIAVSGQRQTPLHIHVVDPGTPGVGIYRAQPDYLLLNTIAEELTGFSDSDMVGVPVKSMGPSFYDWSAANVSGSGNAVGRTEYLPRRLLGEYLAYCFDEHLRTKMPWTQVTIHATSALDIVREGTRETVVLENGDRISVDAVVLAIGHGLPGRSAESDDRIVSDPYPVQDAVRRISSGPETVVAVNGMGLTAIDTIAALTHGRKGRFRRREGKLEYVASGDEPTIVWLSRSGKPFRARPAPTSGSRPSKPVHFTKSAIEQKRGMIVGGRMDFESDVVPLLLREMASILRDEAVASSLFDDSIPESALANHEDYAKWFEEHIESDLAEARRGTSGSRLKAALEILRDQREEIRLAVNQDGLTEESQARFYTEVCTLLNRLVTGPHPDRAEEILALLRAGVVRVMVGPAPRIGSRVDGMPGFRVHSTALADDIDVNVDWIIEARLPNGFRGNPLIEALTSRGRVRRRIVHGRALGLDVDANLRLRDDAGRVSRSLFAFGPPVEGSSFYNHYVPTPSRPSRAVREAHSIACQTLQEDRERMEQHGEASN